MDKYNNTEKIKDKYRKDKGRMGISDSSVL